MKFNVSLGLFHYKVYQVDKYSKQHVEGYIAAFDFDTAALQLHDFFGLHKDSSDPDWDGEIEELITVNDKFIILTEIEGE